MKFTLMDQQARPRVALPPSRHMGTAVLPFCFALDTSAGHPQPQPVVQGRLGAGDGGGARLRDGLVLAAVGTQRSFCQIDSQL